jgi:hypothetical protein
MTTEVLGRSQTTACDGVTTAFPVDFSFKANDDLQVYLLTALDDPNARDAAGRRRRLHRRRRRRRVERREVNTTSPTAGKFIRRWRDTKRDQEADYVPNDGFPAQSHETQLDRLSRVTEEHDDDIARRATVRAPAGESGIAEMPPIVERAGQLLAFTDDANADPIVGSAPKPFRT